MSTAATPGQADAFVQIHIFQFQDPTRCSATSQKVHSRSEMELNGFCDKSVTDLKTQ